MSAYVIVDIVVNDASRYEEYKQMASASVAQYGGRYIVRGGRAQRLEGDQEPNRVVVLEFPEYEQAVAWWESAEYAPGKALRQAIATTRMVVVDGA
jgi:uncharacterized protein (DUF1330 family)